MTDDRDRTLRAMAAEMAAALARDGGAVAFARRFGLLPDPGANDAPAPYRPGAIGIWEPRGPSAPGAYDRSEAWRNEWQLWADTPSLAPKGARKRIVLLGESAAYGFFYAPAFTPAKVLESLVSTALGTPVEVIDLARSGILAAPLAAVAAAALALQPDALVILAGNNWLPPEPPPPNSLDHSIAANLLRERGVKGYQELQETALTAQIAGRLSQSLRWLSQAVPIVLMVPEFNLGDWRLDVEQDAPWLPAGRTRRWHECRAAAREALAAGRNDEAGALAREMIELDQGTAATGRVILADRERQAGDFAAARAHLERARDAHLWETGRQMPRTHAIVQEALRGCALPGRIPVVDLPRLFAGRRGGELPDREVFLDFCHLSATGIRIAMAAAAREAAAVLGGQASRLPTAEALLAAAPAPADRIEAEAHLAAAIWSVRCGQTGPVVSHLCREAARLSPEVAGMMRDYLEVQVRRAPIWSCAAAARAYAAATTAQMRQMLMLENLRRYFDPVLLPAIAGALESAGSPACAFLDQLRREERGLGAEPQELTDEYNSTSHLDRDWFWESSHFYRSHSPVSRFPWVCRAAGPVAFELTCRRTAEVAAECPVLVNGTPLTQVAATAEWTTFRFRAAAGQVAPGVNWLEIRWSLDLPSAEEAMARAAADLESGRRVSLRPVFAEISSLRARVEEL